MPSQKNHTRKIPPVKPKKIVQNPTSRVKRTVQFDQFAVEKSSQTHLSAEDVGQKSVPSPANIISIYENKRLCSVRAAVVTILIIVILIIAAGTSVGIIFAAINSQSSSKTSSNSDNNNQNPFSTVSPGTLTSSVSIGSQSGLPCSAYTLINDPTRNQATVGSSTLCDKGPLFNTSQRGAWIRFTGSGGDRIPMTSPGMNHCGAFLAGWYNNSLPTGVGVITNGTVCFETAADQCGYIVDISVVFCNPYYVYFLPPLMVCSARYCTT